jgi:hypothetical protein
MGNLGKYQAMTTMAKTVGGPVKLAVITAAGGWALGRSAEAGGKKAVEVARVALKKRSAPCATKGQFFEVTGDGADSSAGLTLHNGDSFRVLEGDAESILIEVLDNPNNPYLVSRQFLTRVSDFPADDATPGE